MFDQKIEKLLKGIPNVRFERLLEIEVDIRTENSVTLSERMPMLGFDQSQHDLFIGALSKATNSGDYSELMSGGTEDPFRANFIISCNNIIHGVFNAVHNIETMENYEERHAKLLEEEEKLKNSYLRAIKTLSRFFKTETGMMMLMGIEPGQNQKGLGRILEPINEKGCALMIAQISNRIFEEFKGDKISSVNTLRKCIQFCNALEIPLEENLVDKVKAKAKEFIGKLPDAKE